MGLPEISIIVPVYKSEQFLSKCINSIINQTFKPIEIILINDGSPDKSGEICDEYAKKDNRIKVIHQKNEGVSVARNVGIMTSKSKYIMFSDADDYAEPNWCEKMYNNAIKHKDSLVLSGYSVHREKLGRENKTTIKSYIYGNCERIRKKDFYSLYEKYLLNTPCNKIYLSRIIKENNINFDRKLSLGEDLLFNLDYLKKVNNEILIINEPLYNYIRRDRESLDNKYYKNLINIYIRLYEELYSSMLRFGTDIDCKKSAFYNSYFGMLNSTLENTFSKESNLSFIEKIRFNTGILKSYEFKKALKNASLDGYNRRYIDLLKLENYFLVYFLKKIVNIKNKIRVNKY
ncbi:glycosyltransferase family 2 protein [Jeotgalibacillus soli]|uniref:Glycosyltransferase 2-like domain-containing protein n=1 Tax=Jeotgalibacillus soli TaxID=889306 RepID=A0A0C2VZI9_9BACL|nr:glycosyltransferase family 2 protein [Jeotgalibacillus soli]KIL49368.1 hypothetical protein KP78_08360 [Jeotgalibacillus soli]